MPVPAALPPCARPRAVAFSSLPRPRSHAEPQLCPGRPSSVQAIHFRPGLSLLPPGPPLHEGFSCSADGGVAEPHGHHQPRGCSAAPHPPGLPTPVGRGSCPSRRILRQGRRSSLVSFNPGHRAQPSFLRARPKMPHRGHGGGRALSPMLAPTSMPMHGPAAAPRAGVAPAATRLCRGARMAGEEQRGWPPAPGSRTPQKVPGPKGVRPQGPLCCLAGAAPGPGSATGAAPGVPTGCSGGPRASCSPGGLSPRASRGHGAGRASLWRFPVSPRPFPKSL